jgi:hypothetical protein
MPLLPSPLANASSVCAPENSQPVHGVSWHIGTNGDTPVERSMLLDRVTTQDIVSFIEQGRQMDRQVVFDQVRAWTER